MKERCAQFFFIQQVLFIYYQEYENFLFVRFNV